MSNKNIVIFTDGSCLGNPGPGGCAAILKYKNYTNTISKGYFITTNNRMELMAAIISLEMINYSSDITIYTDSKYLYSGIISWIYQWKKNFWITTNKTPVKNLDLWLKLDDFIKYHKINWFWIKGHTGHIENEQCDKISKYAANNPTLIDIGYSQNKNIKSQ